jgi:hypothetical protein
MKKSIVFTWSFLFYALLFQNYLAAQDTTGLQTLFGNGSQLTIRDIGFFVAPTVGTTQMDGSSTMLFNFRGGLSFKDRLSIGGYFNTSEEIYPPNVNNTGAYEEYWTAGGFMEYTVLPKKLVHLTIPLFVGYGEIEPSALLEINLNKFVRFNVGAGYRFIGKINNPMFDPSDFSGATGYLGLKIGLFR